MRCSTLPPTSWRTRAPTPSRSAGSPTAAGVAPMGVYNHFESKNGIIDALFIQGFERLRLALDTIADIQDPYDALREGGHRYRALAHAHPMVYRLMFLQAVPGFEPSDHALEVATGAFAALVAAVQRAMTAAVIAEAPPNETAQLIWASHHGWVSLELMGIGFVEDQDAAFDRLSALPSWRASAPNPNRHLSEGRIRPPRFAGQFAADWARRLVTLSALF